MIFQEKKLKNGYSYFVEDIFGEIAIDSTIKIKPGTLDDIVVLLLKKNTTAQIVKGEVVIPGGIIKYVFKKRVTWEDDNSDIIDTCKNTPTSTQETAKGTARHRLLSLLKRIATISNLLLRFAVAFREAWRKTKN